MISQNEQIGRLLERMSDGRFHSGVELGETLGCSRAYLWKLVEQLRDWGIEVDSVKGRGYRLRAPIEMLDQARLTQMLAQLHEPLAVEVAAEVGSTNQVLLERARLVEEPLALLAERQTAGRGRWGRAWQAPFGGSLAVSLLWPFEAMEHSLAGLSLVVGVALAEQLRAEGMADVGLKWPNDIVVSGRKLGGILVEVVGEPTGRCKVVIGFGLNMNIGEEVRGLIEQPIVDVRTLLPSAQVSRNEIAAVLLASLARACRQFEREGFRPFRDRWAVLDALAGRDLVLTLPQGAIEGRMAGVDEHGALLLEQADGTRAYFTGETQLKVRG